MPAVVARHRISHLVLLVSLLLLASVGTVAQEPEAGEPTPATTLAPLPSSPVPSPSSAAAPRPDGAWTVTAYDASGDGLVAPGPQVPFSLDFLADGRLEGDVGCGILFGGYFLEDELLSIGVVSRGQSSCGPRRVRAATDLTAALDAVSTWRATEVGLELLDEASVVRVVLEPRSVLQPAGAWVVRRVARPDGKLIAGPDDGSAAIVLHEDGSVTGSTGCRLFDGEWSSEIARITIVVLDTTGLPCEGRPRRIERLLLAALDGVTHWRRSGDVLTLTDGDDRPLVELVEAPAPTEPAPTEPAPTEPDPTSPDPPAPDS